MFVISRTCSRFTFTKVSSCKELHKMLHVQETSTVILTEEGAKHIFDRHILECPGKSRFILKRRFLFLFKIPVDLSQLLSKYVELCHQRGEKSEVYRIPKGIKPLVVQLFAKNGRHKVLCGRLGFSPGRTIGGGEANAMEMILERRSDDRFQLITAYPVRH